MKYQGNTQRLDAYPRAPKEEQSIEALESCAIDRLRLLRAIEDGMSAGKRGNELEDVIAKAEEECELRRTEGLMFSERGATRDATSHFLLRLASCRNAEHRKWFATTELELFKFRFKRLDEGAKVDFLANNGFKACALVAQKECDERANDLRDILLGDYDFKKTLDVTHQEYVRLCTEKARDAKGWFKVEFEEVASLVKARRTYMIGGDAWVRRESIDALVFSRYRTSLHEGLAQGIHIFKKFEESEANRLTPLLKSLHQRNSGKTYVFDGSEAGVLSIPAMEATTDSFPLCMRQLYKAFKTKHHLTHSGRRALQLYLKGIGMQLADALVLWKTEFMKGDCSAEKFEKDYAYGIRHSYGKEGKRVNYTPHSCGQCIASDPGVKDDHGCPFKNLTSNKEQGSKLDELLRSMNISVGDSQKIVEKAKNQHYQIACNMTFAAVHKDIEIDAGVHSPHQYYLESRNRKNLSSQVKTEVPATPSPIAAVQ